MSGVLTNALIAFGVTGVIGYALVAHMQSRGRRYRAGAGSDGGSGGDSYSGTSDGFSLGSWFSSDSSGSSIDACSSSDSGSSGGDCGGGDGGGGGGD